MKLSAAILALFLGACATTNPNGTPTPIGTFDACSDTALKTAAEGILGAVASALATDDGEAALAPLIASTSAAEVLCAVQLVVAELKTKAAADQLAAKELTNGQAYLAKHQADAKK